MSNPIPQSPNEMPNAFYNDQREIRNMIVTLDRHDCVSINWELDVRASNEAEERVGEWEVLIENGSRRVKAKHADILHTLWFATTVAEQHQTTAYEEQEAKKHAALAKLTAEERTLLGVSMQ